MLLTKTSPSNSFEMSLVSKNNMKITKTSKKAKKKTSRKKLKKKVVEILAQIKCPCKEHSDRSSTVSTTSTSSLPVTNFLEFARMRQTELKKLKEAVAANWKGGSVLQLAMCEVDSISLQLEQQALVASLQSDAYRSTMKKIISDLNQSTTDGKLDSHVTNAASKSLSAQIIKSEEDHSDPKAIAASLPEDISPQPPPSSVVAPYPPYEGPTLPPMETTLLHSAETTLSAIPLPSACLDTDVATVIPVKPMSRVVPQTVKSEFEDNSTTCYEKKPPLPLEKSKRYSDDVDLEELTNILEGNERSGQSEEFPKKPTGSIIPARPMDFRAQTKMWHAERYIFMYKVMSRSSSMSSQKYFDIRAKLLELFGEDSDDENEDEYLDLTKFKKCCVQRMIPITAHFVLPYYKKKRITGGSFVYKSLVRRISELAVDDNDYLTEDQVFRLVEKYFVRGQVYRTVEDVFSFVPPLSM